MNEGTESPETPRSPLPPKWAVIRRGIAQRARLTQAELTSKTLQMEEQKRKLEEAQKDSVVDSLTKLPNRRWFDEEAVRKIANARRSGTGFWFLFIDVDEFKIINDQFAHKGGDEVLKLFGALKLREGDALARIGGDEFGMFVNGKTDIDDLSILTDRVKAQLTSSSSETMSQLPINPNREFLDIPIRRNANFSFGATWFDPSEYPTDTENAQINAQIAETIRARADHGAAYSKKEGRGMGSITTVTNGQEQYAPMRVPVTS